MDLQENYITFKSMLVTQVAFIKSAEIDMNTAHLCSLPMSTPALLGKIFSFPRIILKYSNLNHSKTAQLEGLVTVPKYVN